MFPDPDRTCARRSMRSPSASTTPVAIARPKRDSHAACAGSVFRIVPVARQSASERNWSVAAGTGLDSTSSNVSAPSSIASSSSTTETALRVSPGWKTSVPLAASKSVPAAATPSTVS